MSHRLSGGGKEIKKLFCEFKFRLYNKTIFKSFFLTFYTFNENFKTFYLYYSFQRLWEITLIRESFHTKQ